MLMDWIYIFYKEKTRGKDDLANILILKLPIFKYGITMNETYLRRRDINSSV